MTEVRNPELDYFVFSISQKIGLPNYSSIDVFSSLGRTIENTDAARVEVINSVNDVVERQVDLIKENLNLK